MAASLDSQVEEPKVLPEALKALAADHASSPAMFQAALMLQVPDVAVELIEHQALACRCRKCHRISRGTIPAEIVARPRTGAAALDTVSGETASHAPNSGFKASAAPRIPGAG